MNERRETQRRLFGCAEPDCPSCRLGRALIGMSNALREAHEQFNQALDALEVWPTLPEANAELVAAVTVLSGHLNATYTGIGEVGRAAGLGIAGGRVLLAETTREDAE